MSNIPYFCLVSILDDRVLDLLSRRCRYILVKFALLSQPTLDERDYDCCKIWIMRRDCVKLARMFSSSRSGFHGIVSPDPSSRL